MKVSARTHTRSAARWRSPLTWRLSDERLVASMRRGDHAAFGVLMSRYEPRLLRFCHQLLRSREDAEDVLQEVFVSAFNAILADERPINVQPWLYRIAKNRSLNHMRRIKAIAVDSLEAHLPGCESTADTVHGREELRLLMEDIQDLPATQRSALVLREMEALSYEQIAEVMNKSVPSVKSLLVRARRSLVKAAEARARGCAALLPLGPLAVLKRLTALHFGRSTGAGATAAGAGAGVAGQTVIGASSAGFVSASVGAVAAKSAAGLAAAALLGAGAVVIENGGGGHANRPPRGPASTLALSGVGAVESHAQLSADRRGAITPDRRARRVPTQPHPQSIGRRLNPAAVASRASTKAPASDSARGTRSETQQANLPIVAIAAPASAAAGDKTTPTTPAARACVPARTTTSTSASTTAAASGPVATTTTSASTTDTTSASTSTTSVSTTDTTTSTTDTTTTSTTDTTTTATTTSTAAVAPPATSPPTSSTTAGATPAPPTSAPAGC
jgi:RNA polymerase sigma factor (sigma-70 family)